MSGAASRGLFVATILAGSFLLFLVQPMVARMALPRLGGAPNVWNSAMLVYQALLLAGYGYAHRLGKLPLRRQAQIHVGLLLFAALTLPITLANLPPPAPGSEVFWVPALVCASSRGGGAMGALCCFKHWQLCRADRLSAAGRTQPVDPPAILGLVAGLWPADRAGGAGRARALADE